MTHAELPHVDEHALLVRASRDDTWAALLTTLERTFARPPAEAYGRLVGCADTTASGPRPLAVGSSVPGFRVTAADPGDRLVLEGRHRFSRYALVFTLRGTTDGTLLTAETRALFPGVSGLLYRTAVLRTGGHVLGVRRLLGGVRDRAEG